MKTGQRSWVIYGLRQKDTTGIRYVGKTSKKLSDRFGNHLEDARKQTKPRHVLNWINSIGPSNVEAVLLESCPEGDKDYLSYAERYWIGELLAHGHSLTNHTIGGEGSSGYRWSDESRRKLSVAMQGKYLGENNPRYGIKGDLHPLFGKKGEDHPGYGYRDTPERIEAKRKFATGRHHTDVTKEKLSLAHKGKPKSEETRLKIKFSAHKFHHVDRDILKESCEFCKPTRDK